MYTSQIAIVSINPGNRLTGRHLVVEIDGRVEITDYGDDQFLELKGRVIKSYRQFEDAEQSIED